MHSNSHIHRLALPVSCLVLALMMGPTPAVLAVGWDDGVAAFQAGKWSEAEAAFQSQTEATPSHAASWFMLAQAQHRQEKLDAAATSFKKAVELAPNETSYALGWGRNELERGRPDRTMVILGRLNPASIAEKYREPYARVLAAAVLQSESPELAIEGLERAVEAMPETPVLWSALGRARAGEERWEDAWQAYLRAADLSGTLEDRRRVVDLALRRDWHERAAQHAAKVAGASGTAEDFLRLGEAHLGAGDYEQALPPFERAGELAPDDPYPAYYRGTCHLLLKDGERALSAFDAALELEPDAKLLEKALTTRGHALHLLERYEDAAEAYRRAGDLERAEKMEEFAQTAKDNEAWEQAKRECLDRLHATRTLLQDAADLEGTPEYRRLQAELDGLRQECSVYL